ncbi:Dot/Icm type IV secretion system effector CoxFIC1 [Polymorphospora rubra]|uniref:Cell division protein Fic n=1 Tax=Polymorphospora rubra TaxID=338584 RepID=A0A810MYC8_9ACTN|nr:Fic family protein [Polymorphospora rubra]BCJ64378.1 cell division protein Fic [Polymorphospora rubra]
MLYVAPALDSDDRRVLAQIDEFYQQFVSSSGGTRANEWLGGVRKRLVAGAIMGSNTIEGYSVELSTASAIVAGAPVPADVPEESKAAVSGYRDALTWVMQTPEMDFFAHSEMVLSGLHFMMTRAWKGKRPGRYRRGGIVVTGADPLAPAYVGPDVADVPTLMGELVDWLNGGDLNAHLLVRAAMAHLNLVSIHPWQDGNGRMSRCLQTLVIARGGRTYPEFCSIEEWLGHDINTLDYYRVLRETNQGSYQPERTSHGWVRFCLRAHHLQAQLVSKRLRLGREVWEAAHELAQRLDLHERTVSALYAAATDRLRRETYQAEEGLSRDQSIRDIRRLERAGLVAAVGYGPTLSYIAAGRLESAAADIAASLTAPPVEPYPT